MAGKFSPQSFTFLYHAFPYHLSGIYFNISIHTPHTRCDADRHDGVCGAQISIHAPLARCDPEIAYHGRLMKISIHAPLARCDVQTPGSKYCHFPFQSTHLLRGATQAFYHAARFGKFQSTHLLRGATQKDVHIQSALRFQSTHLLRGATACKANAIAFNRYFTPRTSCEVRPNALQE